MRGIKHELLPIGITAGQMKNTDFPNDAYMLMFSEELLSPENEFYERLCGGLLLFVTTRWCCL